MIEKGARHLLPDPSTDGSSGTIRKEVPPLHFTFWDKGLMDLVGTPIQCGGKNGENDSIPSQRGACGVPKGSIKENPQQAILQHVKKFVTEPLQKSRQSLLRVRQGGYEENEHGVRDDRNPIPRKKLSTAQAGTSFDPFNVHGVVVPPRAIGLLYTILYSASSLRRFHCKLAHQGLMIRLVKVYLSHPERLVDVKGPKRVKELLQDLNLVAEAHLVIRGDELVTEDEVLKDGDEVEVRPVISGGSLQA